MRQSTLYYCGILLSAVGTGTTVVGAFAPSARQQHPNTIAQLRAASTDNDNDNTLGEDRRGVLRSAAAAAFTAIAVASSSPLPANANQGEDVPNLQQYEDFTKAPEGFSYRDVTVGTGDSASAGDRVVFEWSGYTIGYFGRPFEAKGGPQGGAFDKAQDYSRTVLGKGDVVKGLELAIQSMKVGSIRQVIVPFGELGYPSTKEDGSHDKVGPKPSTFSGERALNFVLDNPRVDRTLLFNVKLIRVDRADGNGGFKRGDKA